MEFSVQEKCLTEGAVKVEVQAGGHGTAAQVGGLRQYFDAVEFFDGKEMADQGSASLRHDALSLEVFPQPIADLAFFIVLVEMDDPHRAGQCIAKADESREPGAHAIVVHAFPDECFCVVQRLGRIHPGQPLAQMWPVGVYGLEHGLCQFGAGEVERKGLVDVQERS